MSVWRRGVRGGAGLAAVLLLAAALLAWPGGALADEDAPSGSDVEAEAVPASGDPGIYLAGDSQNYDKELYRLDGGMRTFYWEQLNPEKGFYRWDVVDDWLAAEAAEGKPAAALCRPGCGRKPPPLW